MTTQNTVHCQKLDIKAPALAYPPLPGAMGQRVFEHISQPAWDAWIVEQTKWINELRLDATDPKTHQILEAKMLEFLFSEKPIDVS